MALNYFKNNIMIYNCVCNYKKCLRESIYKKYCKKHYLYFFNKYALIIQKNYKKYITNRKLKNIFYKLPNDLQKHIIYFMNIDIYYQKYKNKINSILVKRFQPYFFYKNYNIKFKIFNISEIYYLLFKYNKIINFNILKYFYTICFDIKNILIYINIGDIEEILFFLNFNNHNIVNYINFEGINVEIINNCLLQINKYIYFYEFYYGRRETISI
jgi:hypothetical protein